MQIKIILFGLLALFSSNAIAQKINVVVSFSILQDIVETIGGDHVEVKSIVGPNSDAHVFTPTPETGEILSKADIVIINGLGLEGWFERLIEATSFKGPLVIASQGVHVRGSKEAPDPHAWNDVRNVEVYVENISKALADLDPQGKEDHLKRAQDYRTKLKELDAWVRAQFAQIPEAKRKVITAHDAFSYFGEAYNITFLAPVGINTEAEPSAKDVANLIQVIKREGIKAIFVENITNERLIRQLAEEANVEIGGTLYSDALSDGKGPAATYISMIQHNTKLLSQAMAKN